MTCLLVRSLYNYPNLLLLISCRCKYQLVSSLSGELATNPHHSCVVFIFHRCTHTSLKHIVQVLFPTNQYDPGKVIVSQSGLGTAMFTLLTCSLSDGSNIGV